MDNTAINLEPEESGSLVTKSQAKIDLFREQVSEIITVKPDKTYLVTVTTADQFTLADNVRALVEAERKTIWDDKNKECKQASDLHKSLVAKRDAAVAPYDALKKALVDGGNAYRKEEQRKADEEAARLREEARLKAEEEQLAQAAELEAEGRIDEANEILETEPVYVAPVPIVNVPQVDKRVYRDPVYKVRVKSRLTFLKNVQPETLMECLSEQAWAAIESGLSRKARALGRTFAMNGTELYEA